MSLFWTEVTFAGYLLTLLLVPLILLDSRKQPVSKLAWVMSIVMLPFAGSLLFLVFGINRVRRRAALRQASRRQLHGMLPTCAQYQLFPGESTSPRVERLIKLADRVAGTRCCFGNSIEILSDTNRTLGLIEQAIHAARESIHLEYYIWQPDRTGKKVRDLLISKARQGVKIRFLFDGIGSLWLGRRFLQPMREAGIEVASALPGPTFRERWSVNLRNHRKIVIVDGQIGFTGGMNIGDEYLGKNPRLGFWRDTHLRMAGPVVLQLQQVFAEDWYFATGQALTDHRLYPPPDQSGEYVAGVLAGGPDEEADVFHALFFAAINEANERLTLATSYFVPTPALVAALETAARRGVRVRILVPGIADHQWMVVAARGFYQPLLEAGVEIYEYRRGPLHSKTITIDGEWSLVGTANFDTRSLYLNFEVGVAVVGPRAALALEEQFADDLEHATRIEPATFARRGLHARVAEQLIQLFSPVL